VRLDLEDLRLSVYRSLATTGSAPAAVDLAARRGTTTDVVLAELRELQAARHVALDASGNVVAAADYFRAVGLTGPFWGL